MHSALLQPKKAASAIPKGWQQSNSQAKDLALFEIARGPHDENDHPSDGRLTLFLNLATHPFDLKADLVKAPELPAKTAAMVKPSFIAISSFVLLVPHCALLRGVMR
jgi:hypothetical protein